MSCIVIKDGGEVFSETFHDCYHDYRIVGVTKENIPKEDGYTSMDSVNCECRKCKSFTDSFENPHNRTSVYSSIHHYKNYYQADFFRKLFILELFPENKE